MNKLCKSKALVSFIRKISYFY